MGIFKTKKKVSDHTKELLCYELDKCKLEAREAIKSLKELIQTNKEVAIEQSA